MSGTLFRHPVLASEILQGCHFLEADAGTGKTWTLAGLIVRAVVEAGRPIDALLVVTFTRDAVAELRERVLRKLHGQLLDLDTVAAAAAEHPARSPAAIAGSGDPFSVAYARHLLGVELIPALTGVTPDVAVARLRLRMAIAHFDSAQVFTLHGWCQRVLAGEALLTDAPRRIDNVADSQDPFGDVLAQWWRTHVLVRPLADLELLARTGVKLATLGRTVRKALSHPDLVIRPAAMALTQGLAQIRHALDALLHALREETMALQSAIAENGPDCLQVPRKTYNRGHVARWLHALAVMADPDARTIDPWPLVVLQRFTRERLLEVGADPQRLARFELPGRCSELAALLVQATGGFVAGLTAQCLPEVRRSLTELRNNTGQFTFDGLLQHMNDVLQDGERGRLLARRLATDCPVMMVDEFQDTDPLQWAILESIHRERRDGALILVGDPKQAIYAFRDADVYAYLQARDAGSVPVHLHRLDHNQRSDPQLLAAINDCFRRPDAFLIPQIRYAPSLPAQRAHARLIDNEQEGDEARTPFCWVTLQGEDTTDSNLERLRQLAARATAAEIARLLSPGMATFGGRALEPGDIAILVYRNHEARTIKRALRRRGIGAVELSPQSVFDSVQAFDLVRLLAAVAQPADTDGVRGALATELGGHAAGVQVDVEPWIRTFEQARETWQPEGAQAALFGLLAALGSFERLAAGADGERALTNLRQLVELLGAEPQCAGGAAQALRWLGRTMNRDEQSPAHALRLESDARLVKIVTIHRSKGLEYPIVFVPYAWDAPAPSGRLKSGKGQPIHHEEVAAAPRAKWAAVLDLRGKGEPQASAQLLFEHGAQELRLLYVALTRARQRCHVFIAPGARAAHSALAWLFAGERFYAADKLQAQSVLTDPREVDALLRASAARVPGAVGLYRAEDWINREASLRPFAPPALGVLHAEPFERVLTPAWVQRSYSSILRAMHAQDQPGQTSVADAARDHDERSADRPVVADLDAPGSSVVRPAAGQTVESEAATSQPDNPASAGRSNRFDFPASSQAGVCLHELLEHAEFDRPWSADEVRATLERHGFGAQSPTRTAAWLEEVLDTPLPLAGRALRGTSRADRLVELPFELAANAVSTDRLVSLIARYLPLQETGAKQSSTGYVSGFIDMVWRSNGRYYVIDWKSNQLGDRFTDYDQQAMTSAVREHAYGLQIGLYALATLRALRLRVPGFDYERDFGGVLYLFLRGMHPGAFDAAGQPNGVYAVRPPLELVDALDECFAGRA